MSALEDRRQSAREAYYDTRNGAGLDYTEIGLEEAIETATRVRITPEILAAFKRFGHPLPLEPNIEPALRAAFEAAGFEVED